MHTSKHTKNTRWIPARTATRCVVEACYVNSMLVMPKCILVVHCAVRNSGLVHDSILGANRVPTGDGRWAAATSHESRNKPKLSSKTSQIPPHIIWISCLVLTFYIIRVEVTTRRDVFSSILWHKFDVQSLCGAVVSNI